MNLVAMTVNWLTAARTLKAVKSLKEHCPGLHIYIVDDGSDKDDKVKFFGVYCGKPYASIKIYDPDNSKLKNITGTTYIQVPTHRRHGESIDYAMQFIKSKWIFHIDSDVRITKKGIIDYMMDGVTDEYCGVGIDRQQHPDYVKVYNNTMLFRGDLYHKYKLSFAPIYKMRLEAGSRYFKFLTDKGYKIKFIEDGIRKYRVHTRYG